MWDIHDLMNALAIRPQMVTEVTPAADSWQASWSAWHYPEEERPRRAPQSLAQSAATQTLQSGCTNLRTLLSFESLGDVWEAMLGQASSQDLVIESWTQLLRLN